MIAIEYHADLKEVQSDAPLAALLCAQTAPFDRLEWWRGLTDHCGLRPLIAVARAGDAIAVLPFQHGQGELTAFANWYSFRVRPVVSPGADARALLTALARDIGKAWPRIVLDGVPDEAGEAALIEQAFRAAGWSAFREPSDVNHVLPVAGRAYDAYLASRPGPLRTTLKRKSGKLATAILTRFDDAAWDAYESIYRESWKPGEGSPQFLREFARREAEAGRLRLGLAYPAPHDAAAGHAAAVAAQMWTVDHGVAYIHKLSHRDSARQLSPGSVLSAALFRHVIDNDSVDLVDFGTGDDPYKRDWMETMRPRYRLELFRPHTPRNWLRIAKKRVQRLAAGGNHE